MLKGDGKNMKVYPKALKGNGRLKSATETVNGDGEVSKTHGEALKIDGEALKRDWELKSNIEAFRAKKRH